MRIKKRSEESQRRFRNDIKSTVFRIGLIALWMTTYKAFKHHGRKYKDMNMEQKEILEAMEIVKE